MRRYLFALGPPAFIRFDDTLAEFKPERYFVGPRLLLRELISRQFRLQAVRVDTDFVTNKSMQSILALRDGPNLNYLLGILNSRLMSWYFLRRSNIAQRDDFPKIVLKESRSLPFRPVQSDSDRESHDHLTSLVATMLTLHRSLAAERNPHRRTQIENEIAATDRRIDALVYQLYGLTDEEIAVVEAATA